MSPLQKSFEGPNPKVLLDQIRREVGPDAKINGAEKIHVGGVLGFFAKESYRVVVETTGGAGALQPIAAAARQPAHARVKGRGRRRATALPASALPASALPAIATTPSTASGPSDATVRVRAVPLVGADMFTNLADATSDVNDVNDMTSESRPSATVQRPGPSESVDSFDTVLCRIADSLDDPGAPPPSTLASSASGDATESGGSMSLGTVDAGLVDAGAVDVAALDAGTTYLGALDAGTTYTRDIAAKTITSKSIASEAATFLAGTPSESTPSTRAALRRAGLDDDVAGSVADGVAHGGDLETLLLEALGRMPGAPSLPRRPGSLLVVVGAVSSARELAHTIAGEIGADSGGVPLASLEPEAEALVGDRLIVRSAEDAAELAPGWRRSHAAVVVVDAPLAGTQGSWAAHVISALRPTAVWATVDATCKAEDIRAWAVGLGGIDAVALENLDATVSPAAVLGTGIPVVRLDGRPASAARWTATIVDRVNRCA